MSSYPVLNNRPIDQWRVTDLKDELRKRRLPVKGLKDELVRRLFDSIQSEEPADEAAEDLGANVADDQLPEENVPQETTVTITEVSQETVVHVTQQVEVPLTEVNQGFTISAVGGVPSVDVEASLSETATAKGEVLESIAGENSAFQELQPHAESNVEPVLEKTSEVHTNETIIVNDVISTDVKSDLTPSEIKSDVTEASKIQKQDSASAPVDAFTSDADPMDTDVVAAAPISNDGEKSAPNNDLGGNSSMYDEECKNSKLVNEDCKIILSKPNNQVPEVSPDLGSQIKCDSISSDDISTNKKNNIEDNMNANNFDLELEVKPEMVKPSSGISSLGGDLQPLDDDNELVKNQSSLEDIDSTANVGSYKKDSPEVGSPEKLNLDRSSGDESMDEDVMEVKQVESNMKSDDLMGKTELSSEDVKEVTLPASVVEASSVDTKEVIAEEKPAASAEKRKLEAEETVASTEPIKRLRRWTADSGKVPERQTLNQTGSDAPKDVFQPALKRSFGRSDSMASGDSPKERIVPPTQKPATTSLRIDRFVRPFTLKAVQELLGKTGSVQTFWMDHIKTHCYVTFSSVDEAVATRNAVYNLQWPPNNGNHLVAEFVDPQEVKLKVEPPPPPAAPISPAAASRTLPVQQAQANQSVPRQAVTPREQLPPPPPLAKPPTSDPGSAKEMLPPTPKKPEPPVVTLDDLFKKTQSSPRIYYLPLSEEEVAAKLAAQGKGKKE
ncbi:formin-like protein 5 [Phragmites australis]|uniref:formin-like protein 5 n=1 Tax=Phragmites australis TaxID=29695 RepID=UPI002D79EAF9|nr:formin-like protein 5 [Phragmites australis]